MNERSPFETYRNETLEKIAPPSDSYEVLENSFAVASPGKRTYMHTEDLFDCKAIFLRNVQTKKTLLAHLSCIADIDTATRHWANQVATHDPNETIDITVFTGSSYDSNNDVDASVFDAPELQYPSLERLQSSLEHALSEKTTTLTVNSDASDTPRSIALNLTTGKYYEVDSMLGDGERADVSRNQIIEPAIEV